MLGAFAIFYVVTLGVMSFEKVSGYALSEPYVEAAESEKTPLLLHNVRQ